MAAQISKKKKVGKLAKSLLWSDCLGYLLRYSEKKLFGTLVGVLLGSDVQITVKIQADFVVVEASVICGACVLWRVDIRNQTL